MADIVYLTLANMTTIRVLSGSIFNVVSEEFNYGNTPAAKVDIIF